MRFLLGLDLGQANDPTALAVLERIVLPRPPLTEEEARLARPPIGVRTYWSPPPPPKDICRYDCGHLERLPLGTRYPAIVDHVADLLASPPLAGDCTLVLDKTGVGAPISDLFVARGLKPVGIVIHGGDAVSADLGGFKVPKRDLVSSLLCLLQQERLRFAERLPLVHVLQRELLNFRVTISLAGHDSYSAREGEHDDILLACAIAAWFGEHWTPPPPKRHIESRSWVVGWQPPLFPG
jgi:hypothetical protein